MARTKPKPKPEAEMDRGDLLRLRQRLHVVELAAGGCAPVDPICVIMRERIARVTARLDAEDEKRRLDNVIEHHSV